jgi:hypothetical protein
VDEPSLRWSNLFLRLAMRGGELLWRSHPSLWLRPRGAGAGGEPKEGSVVSEGRSEDRPVRSKPSGREGDG